MRIILNTISSVINFLELIILIECLLSWVIQDRNNQWMSLLRSITTPILEPFRNLQYKYFRDISIDLSPVIAIVLLTIIRKLLYVIF